MSGRDIARELVFFYECNECDYQDVDLMSVRDNPFGLKELVCPKCGGKMSRLF